MPLLCLALMSGCRAFEPDFGRFDIPEVRPLHDRAAQHDALVELRLHELLPDAMEATGIDCWVVVSRPVDPDPVFRWLVRSSTDARGRVILSLCRRGPGVVRRAWGRGLDAVDGLYELWSPTRGDPDPRPSLRAHLEDLDPGVIGVNRSPEDPWADGLSAADAAWLEQALGPSLRGRVVSASPLIQSFLGRHLDSERPLFTEAARLTEAILHEVLSDREVVAAGTSLDDLRWAFRRRAGERDVAVVVEPRAEIWRRGQTLEAERRMEMDLLLQPGDLVFLTGGIRYLDYAVHLGRWAYLLHEGDREPPSWVPEELDILAADLEAALGDLAPGTSRQRLTAALEALSRERGLRALRTGRLGRLLDLWPDEVGPEAVPWSLDPPLPGPGPLALEVSRALQPPGWGEQEIRLVLREAIWVDPEGGRPAIPVQRSPYLID